MYISIMYIMYVCKGVIWFRTKVKFHAKKILNGQTIKKLEKNKYMVQTGITFPISYAGLTL